MKNPSMPALDLPEEWSRELLDLLARHLTNAEVWAYGSRINGTHHEGSDLDLVVRNPRDLRTPQRGLPRLRAAFEESNLPITVEVHDWAGLPPHFQADIEQAHVVFHQSPDASPEISPS